MARWVPPGPHPTLPVTRGGLKTLILSDLTLDLRYGAASMLMVQSPALVMLLLKAAQRHRGGAVCPG